MTLPEIWSISFDLWGEVDIWLPDEDGHIRRIAGVMHRDGTIEAPYIEGESA